LIVAQPHSQYQSKMQEIPAQAAQQEQGARLTQTFRSGPSVTTIVALGKAVSACAAVRGNRFYQNLLCLSDF
jgi:hypothetical protein